MIENGKASLRPAQNTTQFSWNRAFLFDNADIFYTVALTGATSDPTNSYSDLMFWVWDNQNYHTLYTPTNGFLKVARMIGGQWASDPIGWTAADTLKQGIDQTRSGCDWKGRWSPSMSTASRFSSFAPSRRAALVQ